MVESFLMWSALSKTQKCVVTLCYSSCDDTPTMCCGGGGGEMENDGRRDPGYPSVCIMFPNRSLKGETLKLCTVPTCFFGNVSKLSNSKVEKYSTY